MIDGIDGLIAPAALPWALAIAAAVEAAVRGERIPRRDAWLWSLFLGVIVAMLLRVRSGDRAADVLVSGALDGVVLGLIASGAYSQLKTIVEQVAAPGSRGGPAGGAEDG